MSTLTAEMTKNPARATLDGRQRRLRAIPPVHVVLNTAVAGELIQAHGRELVMEAVSETLRHVRAILREKPDRHLDLGPDGVALRARDRLAERLRPRLRRVINATGVVLHTNLGRSPLAEEALQQIVEVASRYSNLELDLETGERGSRYAHVEELVCRLTSAQAAMVVNNNAGAVLLMLSALCHGRDVLVSRGELVEIGGAFRVPEIMVYGGARLVEVGTTNKTHILDYERALTPDTGAILKVHPSNFKIIGFTGCPSVQELADLARQRQVPLLVDWGSGVLVDLTRWGLEPETTMPELLSHGPDLVTFSGDKLVGGPQAGFIVGSRPLVERCRAHPLTRPLRVDKLTLAGIEATLRLYLQPERVAERIPTLRMLAARPHQLRPLAHELADRVQSALPGVQVELQDGRSPAGGGSLPGAEIPAVLVAIAVSCPAHVLEACLRRSEPPILVRIQKGQILLDPRTLWPDEFPVVAQALAACAC